MKNCSICTEKFNKAQRKSVTCPYCSKMSCETCIRQYLINLSNDMPKCMYCSKEWSLEFLSTVTPKSFHNKEYRDYRVNFYLETEKSLLPATQELAEHTIRQRDNNFTLNQLKQEEKDLVKRLKMVRYQIKEIRDKSRLNPEINTEKPQIDPEINTKVKIMCQCPQDNCRGFVKGESKKCGLCGVTVCGKCHTIKTHNHKCNEDDVKSVIEIKKKTKPCPECRVPIQRSFGCDQMWCQHENTPIWLWSGKKKLAKDIVVGDILINQDGNPCKVQTLTSGTANMYKIEQKFGEDYLVIGKHLLTLRNNNQDVDISVEDYLKLSQHKRIHGYHRVACKTIQWPLQPTPIDPYIFGLWLGDGTARGDGFASNDIKIIQKWVEWSIQNNMEVIHSRPFGYDLRNAYQGQRLPVGYGSMAECTGCQKKPSLCCASIEELERLIESDHENTSYQELYIWKILLPKRKQSNILGKNRKPNLFKILLNECGVLKNKHVPIIYLQNDENTRLQLLAGLLDTDGNRNGNAFRISQCFDHKDLCDSIIDLAHSLGFATTKKIHIPGYITFPHGKTYKGKKQIKIRIMGATERIPVILEHKKITKGTYPASTIKVIDVGIGRYVGWSISGKSKRYLLGDGTVTHNCTNCHTRFDWVTCKKITSEFFHNPHMTEWQRLNNEIYESNNRLPSIVQLEQQIRQFRIKESTVEKIISCYNLVQHIQDIEMQKYPLGTNIRDNTDLRVKYLLNELSEKDWIFCLKKRQKKMEKDTEIHQTLDMFVQASIDIINQIMNVYDKAGLINLVKNLIVLKGYTNQSLFKIKTQFDGKIPQINNTWNVIIE